MYTGSAAHTQFLTDRLAALTATPNTTPPTILTCMLAGRPNGVSDEHVATEVLHLVRGGNTNARVQQSLSA